MNTLNLLAVFAHPDDESMGMGATLAKYSAEGVDTHLICASRGERGWFGSEEQFPGPERLGQIRTVELQNAVRELGMKSLHFLDYIDGDVDQAPHVEAIAKIVTHIRKIKPQVVVTFPPDGNYGHPDHVAIGQFTCAAIVCAADSSYVDPQGLAAHCVSKLYYMVDGENFINLVAPFMGDMTFPVDDQIRGEFPWKDWMITTKIDMAEHCIAAWKAIQCHQSQLSTLGALAELPSDSAASVLAMQGTFYRAFSLVNGGRKIESDFFEGLR
ncbi:MAG: PIG-L family deacetylase [Anaerolineales bacterium]|uniref:PIG-L deacetylase family protein n=1 Tax=Candidatus Villigracilis proximus TaxID=3140683 RepID=UPI003136C2B7|nr:PIG-L family deacetylase [Anaerolineales bacterium]